MHELGISVTFLTRNPAGDDEPTRDRLRRTRDGRYEVGVYIEKDKYARFVPRCS